MTLFLIVNVHTYKNKLYHSIITDYNKIGTLSYPQNIQIMRMLHLHICLSCISVFHSKFVFNGSYLASLALILE